ncbi:capsular polysaccharide biosynthesis protein [Hamadaea flava]|uniref:Capsular polysaccharide biosynthesis protein n=1 Tax=Hamadaea flava TaxID=1742688 RepID=A0ABV8LIJ9_9ACTN|nr:capsular polysaccharide biosynthesis protein [Hamadaea flava]
MPTYGRTTVDFWDLAKVLFRNWVVAVPMLLLTTGLTVLTFSAIKPDYVATAFVQLVPPATPVPAKVGEPARVQVNPWLGQGLQTLGNAAIVTVQEQSVVDAMKAAGYTDSFTFEMGGDSPLVKIEAVGKSKEQASGTADELVARYSESVTTLQKNERVIDADLIAPRRLDRGTNVEKSNSNVKRALVAVFVAGLMLTVAATVGFDALLRSRAKRRAGAMSAAELAAARERAVGMASGVRLSSVGTLYRPRAITTATGGPSGGTPPDEATAWSAGDQTVVYRTVDDVIEPTDIADPDDEDKPEVEDATLVLPSFTPMNGVEIPRPSAWPSKE